MKESILIQDHFKRLTNNNKAAQGLMDDAAKISLLDDQELIISKDIMVEDVHFLRLDGGFKIASKLLASNLSDLAASGAKPVYYMLGFAKNDTIDDNFTREFTRGLASLQDQYGLSLIGGDTITSKTLFFSITIFGTVEKGQSLLRSQAQDGDLIYVSGDIGDAFLGRTTQYNDYLQNRHFFPTPRVALGQALLQEKLSQCGTDISDGLAIDLDRICNASNLSAKVEINNIPLSQSAKECLQKDPKIEISDLLSGGDDYELLFTIHPQHKDKIEALSQSLNIKLSCIGHMQKAKKTRVIFLDANNQPIIMNKLGYEH